MSSVSALAKDGSRVLIYTSGGKEDPLVYKVDQIKRAIAHLVCEKTGKSLKVHRTRIREILGQEAGMGRNAAVELDDELIEDVGEETDTTIENADTSDSDGGGDDEGGGATATATASKPPKAPKQPKEPKAPKPPKAAPTPVDFSALVAQGHEVWTKENLSFDVESVKVDAHCVISPDQKSYRVFNTYNGSLGKKGATGTDYEFTESMTLDKKRKSLEKKGYVKRDS